MDPMDGCEHRNEVCINCTVGHIVEEAMNEPWDAFHRARFYLDVGAQLALLAEGLVEYGGEQ